jgi:hypothetical protein
MALTRPKIKDIDTSIIGFTDPITVLHQGATSANVDVGFLFNRANGLVSNVALYWSESAQSMVVAYTNNAGVTNTNVSATSYANVTVGNISANAFYFANGTPFVSSSYGNVQMLANLAANVNTVTFGGNIYANTAGTTTTVANLVTTSGVYWANGSPYSSGSGGGSGITYTASTTAPTSPKTGDQWYYTTGDILYEYQNVSTGSFWVDITSPTISSGTVTIPGGDVLSPFLLMGT